MYNKSSPAPRNPAARISRSTNATNFSHSLHTTHETAKFNIPEITHIPNNNNNNNNNNILRSGYNVRSISQSTPFMIESEECRNAFSPSDIIVPFHLNVANHLTSRTPQEREKDCLEKEDILELQMSVEDYVEGLLYSTRQVFMRDNEIMVEQLQKTSDISITSLFFQMQREMRQLSGDDSTARDRQLIEKLSDLLES